MNTLVITFPQTFNSISTINLRVKVDLLDLKGNIVSSIRCVLKENDILNSSDLDMTAFISGQYNITILDSVDNPYTALAQLFITGYTQFNPLTISSTDQIIDVVSYDNITATNSDTITHNLNNINVFPELISKDPATMNQVLITVAPSTPLKVNLSPNSVTVENVVANGYTKYKVVIFNRANNVNQN